MLSQNRDNCGAMSFAQIRGRRRLTNTSPFVIPRTPHVFFSTFLCPKTSTQNSFAIQLWFFVSILTIENSLANGPLTTTARLPLSTTGSTVEGFPERIEALFNLFKSLLQDPDSGDVSVTAVRTLGIIAQYTSSVEKKKIPAYQVLIPRMTAVMQQCREASGEQSVRHLIDGLTHSISCVALYDTNYHIVCITRFPVLMRMLTILQQKVQRPVCWPYPSDLLGLHANHDGSRAHRRRRRRTFISSTATLHH